MSRERQALHTHGLVTRVEPTTPDRAAATATVLTNGVVSAESQRNFFTSWPNACGNRGDVHMEAGMMDFGAMKAECGDVIWYSFGLPPIK